MTYNGTLVLPSSYMELSEEEMMYTEGGVHWKSDLVAKGLDLAILFATAGLTEAGTIGQFATKVGWTTLKSKAKAALIKFGVKESLANTAVKALGIVTGFTIGNGIAYVVDRYDSSGLNGYIDF